MMNSKSLLGDARPTGGKRVLWNTLMILATGLASFGAYWSIKTSAYPTYGFIAMGVLISLAAIVQVTRCGNNT